VKCREKNGLNRQKEVREENMKEEKREAVQNRETEKKEE
jgi:hypothetical protein